MTDLELTKAAAKILDKRKAENVTAIEITDCTIIADYFVLATATSTTHVKALAGELEEKLKEIGAELHHIEGRSSGWVLLDYGTVVIHLFTADQRDYYKLERLWEDGKKIDLTDVFEENKQ